MSTDTGFPVSRPPGETQGRWPQPPGIYRIRVVAATGTFYGIAMTAGDIYTVPGTGTGAFSGDGGPAASAEIHFPGGVAVDRAGNLIIADDGNGRIRVVAAATGTFYGQHMRAGHIYTVAGRGAIGFSGDGGPAAKADLQSPYGVTVDQAGDLVFADQFAGRIREVTG
jgi:DNA-binding beta-propeller fold protein YncE